MAEYLRISQRRCVQYIPMHLQEEPQGEVYINPIWPGGGTLCPPVTYLRIYGQLRVPVR